MSKAILVTGATGKQGGSVIDNLLARNDTADYLILAVTRDPASASAKRVAAKGQNIKVVGGDLDDVSSLFDEAVKVAAQQIWGVYSLQISMGKGVTLESEVRQGTQLIDESVRRGVKHFVYSSVERGGDIASWDTPTPIDHFQSKHQIEHHLRDNAGSMTWTILRPVAFMENLAPGMQSRVFLTALRDSLNGKPNQWVAVNDIGWFAALSFSKPDEWNGKAIGLAGDQLTYDQQQDIFMRNVTDPPTPTFAVLGSILKYMVGELGRMLNWFGTDGYKVDIDALRKIKPDLITFEKWLTTESTFTRK